MNNTLWAVRAAVRHELRLMAVALQFMTRLPVPAMARFEPVWLNQCARHFPLVGAAVGLLSFGVWWVSACVWPSAVAVLLSMAATAWLTGGFHEDGLADTLDALGGAVPREKALLIMKDSRIGSYGALALILVLALKAVALTELSVRGPCIMAAAMLLSHTGSRLAAVAVMAVLPYAGDAEHAKAKPLATSVSTGVLAVALGWGAVAWAAAARLTWHVDGLGASTTLWSAVAAGVLLLCTAGLAAWFRRRLQGFTGDTLGATQQLTELALLLAWLAVA